MPSDPNNANSCTYGCEAGYKAITGSGTASKPQSCEACPPGTYSLKDTSICTPCPSGKIASSSALATCTTCTVGSVPNAEKTLCDPCAAGTMNSVAGSSSCSACALGTGTYQDIAGQSSCKTCVPSAVTGKYNKDCGGSSPGTASWCTNTEVARR
jgi:hypothetical protein